MARDKQKGCGLCVLDARKDCGLCFVELHFYLYWETTKTVACVFWIPADCGLCFVELHFYLYWKTTKTVAQDTAKTAACVQKGFYNFYDLEPINVFVDFM